MAIRRRPGAGRSRGNEGEIPTGLESRWSDSNKCIETILAATRQERVQPFVLSDATGPGENTHSGELSEGDVLASEEELARTYQVSRTTARQALHGLKTSGYAYSQKGRGTFVTRPKPEKNIMWCSFNGEAAADKDSAARSSSRKYRRRLWANFI